MGATVYSFIYEYISIMMIFLAYVRISNRKELIKLVILALGTNVYTYIFLGLNHQFFSQLGITIYIVGPMAMYKIFGRNFKYCFAVFAFINLFLFTGENIGITIVMLMGVKSQFVVASIIYSFVFIWSLILLKHREFITNLFEYFVSKQESKLAIIYLMVIQVLIKYYKIFYFQNFYISYDAIFLSQIVVVCFVIYLYRNSYIKRELENNRFIVELLEEELIENRARSHEYKNHYACLIGLCNNGGKEDIVEYLKDMEI